MPAKPKPRTKPPEERREDLMNAAERLFLEHGVASTTIEQITSGADVAKGTFYLHFSSKDDVIDGLRRRFVDKILDCVRRAVAERAGQDWRETLAAWVRAFATSYLDSARLHELVFKDVLPPSHDGLTNNSLIDDLRDLLAAGGDADGKSIEDPRFAAIFLFNALHGVVLDAMVAQDPVDHATLERLAVELSFRVAGLPRPTVTHPA